ncbi:membrane protein [Kitasatospora sp. MAP12-15]|uniref:YhjD/YihY/BrkB family envelope integrity protein n=1 Tax=unclassified Kitasatospora TaxID=2633591 RepID=UPI00247442EC|nr:YhjD/YihY/BrkB family envelope integrity protein [Kitasatospora sp. MAP12-44]MDH6113239.1 membrane protein [Kitasatospora sp. MAP12-44]
MAGTPEGSDRSGSGGVSRVGRLHAWGRRLWSGGKELELMHRAMGFAALGFVTLVPLLITLAAASPVRGAGFAGWMVDGLGVSGSSADAVRQLFSSPRRVLSTTTALSLAAVAFFGVSFMAAVQTGYERIWKLKAAPWHSAWRQTLGLAGLAGYLLAASWTGVPWRHSPIQPALGLTWTTIVGVIFFWWLQRLLLSGRVGWRPLFPGACATVAALVGLRLFSQLVFAPLIVSSATSYGAIGTVLVVQSWLIGVGFTVFAGALVGRVRFEEVQHMAEGPARSDGAL